MQAYWTTTKPDGTPITGGRLCRVVDLEDGSIPVRVYGKTQDEIFSKIERTMATAQLTVNDARRGNNDGAQPPANRQGAAPPLSNPAILSADETMRLTVDLQNPAKSAEASYKLAESERAKRTDAQEQYLSVCRGFAPRHPEFFNHKTNRTLLINKALLTVGQDVSKITAEVLDLCYEELIAADALLTENEVRPEETHQPSTVPPNGSSAPVLVRPANGVTSSTSHRSSRLGAPTAPQWKPKLTQDEIGKLTTKETDAILRGTHSKIAKKDYEEACEYFWSKSRATA